MKRRLLKRMTFTVFALIAGALISYLARPEMQTQPSSLSSLASSEIVSNPTGEAASVLEELEVKGRAPKTGYERDLFGDGWGSIEGCDTRNYILKRDLINTITDEQCRVISGMLNSPYTGSTIIFERGETTSAEVQIDHVVSLSDAWQKGAQQLMPEERVAFANDPLELLAVDGEINSKKSDNDAASWLPPNKDYRCSFVARQIAVKKKYSLWVTSSEKDAMKRVLAECPGQVLPS